MRRRASAVLFLAAIVVAHAFASLASPLSAQTIRGRLLEQGAERPVELGRVLLVDAAGDPLAGALTDSTGHFSLSAPSPGSFFLTAEALGYRSSHVGPLELEAGMETTVELRIEPEALPLEGLAVEVDAADTPPFVADGFLERMRAGRGEFLTPEDIWNSDARFTPQLFRGLDRVVVRPGLRGGLWNQQVLMRRVLPRRGEMYCTPHVFLDGIRVPSPPGAPPDYLTRDERAALEISLEEVVSREDLAAVEIYDELRAPLRYVSGSSCGVILLWTW
jgi:hypothetical protein